MTALLAGAPTRRGRAYKLAVAGGCALVALLVGGAIWKLVTTGAFNPGPGVPDTATTPAEVAAWYEERYTRNFEELAKATPAQLLKVVDFRGIVQQPAIGFIVTGLHHTIHHRGQLTSYLRAMGAKVPAIYGESYDSAIAKRGVTA